MFALGLGVWAYTSTTFSPLGTNTVQSGDLTSFTWGDGTTIEWGAAEALTPTTVESGDLTSFTWGDGTTIEWSD